jgi:Leucine-rich repeat (LRR) protein
MLFNEYILKSFEEKRRGLKDLTLEQINFLELASNAFQDTPLLKNLTLDGREYSDAEDPIIRILPKNIFAGLNKLENLEIKALWLSVLDENIFQDLVELKVLELIYDIFATLPEKIFQNQHKLESLTIRNSHNNDSVPTFTLPENIFQGLTNLTLLELGGNDIITLPENLIQSLRNLDHINLSYNKIDNLPEQFFQGLTKLKHLDLRKNKLESLPENIFQGLIKLEILNLSQNELTELPEMVFQGLTSLKNLQLDRNKLTELPEKIFQGLVNLSWLELKENLLTIVSTRTFQGLPKLKYRMLDDNVKIQEMVPQEVEPFTKEDIQQATTDIKLAENKTADNNNILLYACKIGDYVNALLIAKLMVENKSKNISIQNAKGDTALNYLIKNKKDTTEPALYGLLLKDFLEKYDPADECVVCNEVLDGIKGPDDKDKAKGNEVITVCKNSHRFHRNCILSSCRVSGVNILGQMSMEGEHLQAMDMNTVCPLCKEPLLPNCNSFATKLKLPFPLPSVSGGKRRKSHSKKRTQSGGTQRGGTYKKKGRGNHKKGSTHKKRRKQSRGTQKKTNKHRKHKTRKF